MSTYFEKITLTVRGGDRGVVNTYGQPDHKKKFFFYNRPYYCIGGRLYYQLHEFQIPLLVRKTLDSYVKGDFCQKSIPDERVADLADIAEIVQTTCLTARAY